MRLWELSYLHEKVFVVKKMDDEFMFFIEIPELQEQLMSRIFLRQDPGVDDDVGDLARPRGSHAQLVETVALDHSTGP